MSHYNCGLAPGASFSARLKISRPTLNEYYNAAISKRWWRTAILPIRQIHFDTTFFHFELEPSQNSSINSWLTCKPWNYFWSDYHNVWKLFPNMQNEKNVCLHLFCAWEQNHHHLPTSSPAGKIADATPNKRTQTYILQPILSESHTFFLLFRHAPAHHYTHEREEIL